MLTKTNQNQFSIIQIKKLILSCSLVIILFLSFNFKTIYGQSLSFTRSSLDQAELIGGYIAILDFIDNSDYYDNKGSYGIFLGFMTRKLLGIGATYIDSTVADKVDPNIKFHNNFQFIDIYFKLPIPSIIELIAGIGLGNNNLICESDSCALIYNDATISKDGDTANHIFLLAGTWIGKIYNLQLGFHLINGIDYKISLPSTDTRIVPQSALAYSIGLALLF